MAKSLNSIKFLLVGLTASLFFSCSNSGGIIGTEVPNTSQAIRTSNILSVKEAETNVMNFVSKIYENTRSSGAGSLQISTTEAITNKLPSSRANTPITDTLFYVVNFKEDRGFAIAAADADDTPIYALIEEGNYKYDVNDTISNGFNLFMSALIELKSKDLDAGPSGEKIGLLDHRLPDDSPSGPGIYLPNKFEIMRPLLKCKWGQYQPYNDYCDGNVTGCVMTAATQICSFLERPSGINYQTNKISWDIPLFWDKINKDCEQQYGALYSGTESGIAIGMLMRFWGDVVGADYGKNSTSADTGKMIDKMRFYGLNVTGLSSYNCDNVITDLKSGNKIIMMRGNGRYYHIYFIKRKYVDGHCWVVDGYIDEVKNNKQHKYIHCNWGWNGTNNGYFLSDVLNADTAPVYDDNYTRSNNFRYKLQYATFTK